jgi:hypothetical protein
VVGLAKWILCTAAKPEPSVLLCMPNGTKVYPIDFSDGGHADKRLHSGIVHWALQGCLGFFASGFRVRKNGSASGLRCSAHRKQRHLVSGFSAAQLFAVALAVGSFGVRADGGGLLCNLCRMAHWCFFNVIFVFLVAHGAALNHAPRASDARGRKKICSLALAVLSSSGCWG